ncbi:arginine/serine-rich protein 1 [Cynoglossus semilaevis]|uniref:arginine/serine-rich protein 1 n=1 Tax=Cynoglossus semilaevis TaxID=244447 RepID=UPI00049616F8|nr:arginine/serine-rich protein 1 [Cynoglossus semilaevis]
MAKDEVSPSEITRVRQSDGITVIFDQNSPTSSPSRSRSRSRGSGSVGSDHNRSRVSHRGRYRSSSSSESSSSRSTSHSRSRSRPRCHRPSSRCRCDKHYKYGRRRRDSTAPCRYRGQSRSHSDSPSPDRYSQRKCKSFSSRAANNVSRRRSPSSLNVKISPSASRSSTTYRSRSRSRSPQSSLTLSDKRELLKAAKTNAMKILGVENLRIPESVKPILAEQLKSGRLSPEPGVIFRKGPKKVVSESHDMEHDDVSNPRISPVRRTITFSINNSVAKPTVSAPSCGKVTARVDSYDSRKPYGSWLPVKSRHSLKVRKGTISM